MSDLNEIREKQASSIVRGILKYLVNDDVVDFGFLEDGSVEENLVEEVIRVLSPQFEDYVDNFESSNIAAYAYDERSEVLQVDFQSGGRYQYFGVEPSVFTELQECESKGKYISGSVKKKFPCGKIA